MICVPPVTSVPVIVSPAANAPEVIVSIVSVVPAIVPLPTVGWIYPAKLVPVAVVSGPIAPLCHANVP